MAEPDVNDSLFKVDDFLSRVDNKMHNVSKPYIRLNLMLYLRTVKSQTTKLWSNYHRQNASSFWLNLKSKKKLKKPTKKPMKKPVKKAMTTKQIQNDCALTAVPKLVFNTLIILYFRWFFFKVLTKSSYIRG